MNTRHPCPPGPTRRAFLGGSAALGAALAIPGWPVKANPALRRDPRSFRVSLSVSPFTEAVLGSLSLTDGRRTASTVRQVQQLFNLHGASEVFARVATRRNASSGDAEYGFARAIERAQLARDLGMPLNPELGLWAVYGDISGQPPPDFSDYPSISLPGTWTSLALPQMEAALRQYGALVAQQILATGVTVIYWDLGNEVDWGVAGVAIRGFSSTGYSPPDAVDPAIGQMTAAQLLGMTEPDRISWLQQHMWPYVGRLLAATAAGVRSIDPAARFSTHVADIEIASPLTPVAFWAAMNQAGYRPSQFGTSFYPTSPGPGDRRAILLQIATALRQRFGRQLFLAVLRRIRAAGAGHVVLLTSRCVIGGIPQNAVTRMWLDAEAAVRDSGVGWTILRPSGFHSNALRWLPQLREGDVVRAPWPAVPIAAIDPADIAAVASVALTEPGYEGAALTLSGPEPLTPGEQVAALAAALRRPLRYQPLTDDEACASMAADGIPAGLIDAFFRFFSAGEFDDSATTTTVHEIIGRPPHTFEHWAHAHTDLFGDAG